MAGVAEARGVLRAAADLRAHELVLLAADVGSFSGLAARMMGNLAPVDLLAVFDRLDLAANALQRAAAEVWLFADSEMVALANAVVLAATDVVDAHHRPKRGRAWTYANVALAGRLGTDDEQIAKARSGLAEARRALIVHARATLDLPLIEPFLVASAGKDL